MKEFCVEKYVDILWKIRVDKYSMDKESLKLQGGNLYN